jgi:hypothetical protein
MPDSSALFPRNFNKTFPVAVRGKGCWIMDSTGRRFLDASGQAAVVSIGHGVKESQRKREKSPSRIPRNFIPSLPKNSRSGYSLSLLQISRAAASISHPAAAKPQKPLSSSPVNSISKTVNLRASALFHAARVITAALLER